MINQNNKRLKKEIGFSLLGVIVAVFVTSVGLVAILQLSNAALKGALPSKMRIIAAGLAQEGIEIVRDLRKRNSEWDDWYSSIIDGDYLIQYDSNSLVSFSETPLLLDENTGLYQYDLGEASSFYRKVNLTKISADEVSIVAEVKWFSQENWHYLTVEDRLWNWK